MNGLLCCGLLLSGRDTWESLAPGFMVEFLTVFSAFFWVVLVKFIR